MAANIGGSLRRPNPTVVYFFCFSQAFSLLPPRPTCYLRNALFTYVKDQIIWGWEGFNSLKSSLPLLIIDDQSLVINHESPSMIFGPLRPRTTEAFFGTLFPVKSANSGGARGVSFYIITDDLQAHKIDAFYKEYAWPLRIIGALLGVYSPLRGPILEGPRGRNRQRKPSISTTPGLARFGGIWRDATFRSDPTFTRASPGLRS